MYRIQTLVAMLAVAYALLAGDPAVAEDEAAIRQAIVKSVRREQSAAVDLLERTVNINSGTLNFAGVRAVADVFATQFASLGFESTWIDGKAFGRAGHLVLRRKGKGPRVLLIGHLDTVFERTHPFQHFERVNSHIVRGPGTADMKGGVIVALTALRAVASSRTLDRLDLTVVLHGDEEHAGTPLSAARAALIDAAKHADVALGLENAADDPQTAVVARRSSSQWRLDVEGHTSHSSRIFSDEVGAGASYEIARVLHSFYEQLHGQRYLTFSPGVVLSGSQLELDPAVIRGTVAGKSNVVADRAMAIGDLRALTPQQIDEAVKTMQDIVARSLPQTRSTLTFTHSYPPMPPTPGNEQLLQMYDAVSRALGHGAVAAVDPGRAGAADISFAASYTPMNMDGLGLLGGKAHTAQEFADLRTLPIQAERLALLLYRLARDSSLRKTP